MNLFQDTDESERVNWQDLNCLLYTSDIIEIETPNGEMIKYEVMSVSR